MNSSPSMPPEDFIYLISNWTWELRIRDASYKKFLKFNLRVYKNFYPNLSDRKEMIQSIKDIVIKVFEQYNTPSGDRLKILYNLAYETGFLEKENLMSFEDVVRVNIRQSAMGSNARNVLKVLLGELQKESSNKILSEEASHAIVRKLIKGNDEMLVFLKEGDAQFAALKEENEVLSALVPALWTEDQVKELITANSIDIKSMGEGQAVGMVMKALKAENAPVDGSMVKQLVIGLRKA